MSATSALSDRIKIMRKAQFPTVNLAPQVIISCVTAYNGCSGGDQPSLYEYVKQNGLTDETCSNYQALGLDDGRTCTKELVCLDCTPEKCAIPDSYNVFHVDSWGELSPQTVKDGDNVTAMMNEIMQRGPIVCGVDASPLVRKAESPTHIYTDAGSEIDHDISVVGWGETAQGQKFWVVRNSWGSTWSDEGFF